MKKEIIIFCGGLLAGGLAVGLWMQRHANDGAAQLVFSEQVEEKVSGDLELARLLKEAETEIESLKSEIGAIREPQIKRLLPEGVTVLRAVEGHDLTLKEGKGGLFFSGLHNATDQRLRLLSQRLGLSDEQVAAFDDIFALKRDRFLEMLERGEQPEPSMLISQNDMNDLAADILSDEQLEEYNRLIEEERRGRNEMMATARLNQIGPSLGLDEDQRNEMYAVFYAEADMMNEGLGREEIVKVHEETDRAIREILTEEQQATYEEMSASPMGFSSSRAVFITRP